MDPFSELNVLSLERNLIGSEKYADVRYGFKLSGNNIGHKNGIYTFPYFCVFLLKRFMKTFHPDEEKTACPSYEKAPQTYKKQACSAFVGVREVTRTPDLSLRRRTLYPTELRRHLKKSFRLYPQIADLSIIFSHFAKRRLFTFCEAPQ